MQSQSVIGFNDYLFHGLIEHGLTSASTQYRLYGRRFLQVNRPNQQYQSTEGKSIKEKSNNVNSKIYIPYFFY